MKNLQQKFEREKTYIPVEKSPKSALKKPKEEPSFVIPTMDVYEKHVGVIEDDT